MPAIDFMLLLGSVGISFFILMALISVYLYIRFNDELALYMSTAFIFFTLKEFIYLLADYGITEQNTKVMGVTMGFFAAAVFVWVFMKQEKIMEEVLKVVRSFKI
jgi:hypothetical protein